MSDEYPTEETLKAIREWPMADLVGLFARLRSEWNWPDRAWLEGDEHLFSTGGWSGNESLIAALSENDVAWSLCWKRSARGGHHVFEIPGGLHAGSER